MSKQCLVVDDVEVSRYVAKEILIQLGFEVEEIIEKADVLEKLESKKFDLIIIDWHLRQHESLELIPKMREISGYQNVPIILTSGVELAKELKDVKKFQIESFIKKPLTYDKLRLEMERLSLV